MKTTLKRTHFAALMILFLVLFVTSVYAPWESLSSGYAVWTNYHGVPVPTGTEVTATAGTTEHPDSPDGHPNFPKVTHVRFRWMPPEGSGLEDFYSPVCALTWDGSTYNGWRVYTADDKHIINALGDWGVQALFYNNPSSQNPREESDVAKIRAVSVNVVPDIPVIGTAGAAVLMLLGLGLYWHNKARDRKHLTKSPSLA